MYYNNALEPLGLTYGQARVLCLLYEGYADTQKSICKTAGVKGSSTSNVVLALEKKMLVTRKYQEKDNRVKEITITKKGAELCREVLGCMAQCEEDLFQGLSETDIQKFLQMANLMISRAEVISK